MDYALTNKATCMAFNQFQLPENIACAILISNPHIGSENPAAWWNLELILKTYSNSKSKHSMTAEIAKVLKKDCDDFQKAFLGIPVLSVFEQFTIKPMYYTLATLPIYTTLVLPFVCTTTVFTRMLTNDLTEIKDNLLQLPVVSDICHTGYFLTFYGL